MRKIVNDGVDALTRNSQAQSYTRQASYKTKKSENESEIPLSRSQPHHRFY